MLRELIAVYPWRFIGFIILASLIPKVYDLTNMFWVGQISYDALAVTKQYDFLAVAVEVINETVPFGVLALIAQNYTDRKKVLSILKSGLVIQVALSAVLTAVVFLCTPTFVSTIGTPAEIVTLTESYIHLMALALPFDAIAFLLLIAVKAMRKGKAAMLIVLLSVVLNVVFDLLFISTLDISLHLGVMGVALGYILSKSILAAVSLGYLVHILDLNILRFVREIPARLCMIPIFKIGGWTGLDSLVRNAGYVGILMALNLIGVSQFGGYGLAMTVMWTLLVPVLALAEATNVVVGNYYGAGNYLAIPKVLAMSEILALGVIGCIAMAGLLSWDWLSAVFNPNPEMVAYSVQAFHWLIVPYIFFAAGIILKSLFYGTGMTKYIFFVSLIVQACVVFPFVILMKAGAIVPVFTTVMTLFVFTFTLDLICTVFFAHHLLGTFPQAERGEAAHA
ncbi:MATE family efflux transporter [Methanofollis formosanus]|nr:MATE family efflux transporter [Methanofollis formosanus]